MGDHYTILFLCMVEHYHNKVEFFGFFVFKRGRGVSVKEKRDKKRKGFFFF